MNTPDGELLKSVLSVLKTDATMLTYINSTSRYRQDGSFNYKELVMPAITAEVEIDNSMSGVDALIGNLRISVWNDEAGVENKRITREIASRVNVLLDGTNGKNKLNATAFSPKVRFIEQRAGMFMDVEVEKRTRYIINLYFIVGKQ